MPDDNIIHLFGEPPAVDGAPTSQGFGVGCYPHTPLIDKDTRAVTCKRCKAVLDPIDVLLQVARNYDQWVSLLEQTKAMRRSLEALKEQEQRVKQRTKSHSRKDAAEAVAAEKRRHAVTRLEVLRRTDDIRRAVQRIDQLMGKPSNVDLNEHVRQLLDDAKS